MRRETLLEGYKKVITTIYSQKAFFERAITFLKEFRMPSIPSAKTTFTDIKALVKAVWRLGIVEHGRRFFWKLIAYSIKNCPEKFHYAVSMAVYGFHFRKVADQI